MIKNKEQILSEIEECKQEYEQMKEMFDHFCGADFVVKNCDIEAMRELLPECSSNELKFWEHSKEMVSYYKTGNPSIRLHSPEIDVEEHVVTNYAYKNV